MTSMIWIPSATEAWEPVIIVSSDANSVTVKRRNSPQEFKVAGSIINFSSLTPESLEENCDNLVDLETYNEGIILYHIKRRFSNDTIYTLVSNILIALNPYKPIDIYGTSIIDRIFSKVKRGEEVPPHVFSIAAAAVFNAKESHKDQSVLISGESGAGKTEATKKILQFISTVCSSGAQHSSGHSVENQILDTNPLLESFGNAKTIRNNNSSRFGKYMEVNFDKSFHIQGCQITAYLLEKSRVVRQGPNERNYHVFYMLLAGANKDWRRDFFLKPADEFAYLSQSGCIEIDRRSELKEFDDMVFAMQNLNISHMQQTAIFQSLAAILHLGNLQFQSSRDIEGGSKIQVPAEARRVAGLLGVDADSLERVLCHKDATINGESLLIPLTPEKAVDQRDSLAKYVYGKLFDFIVFAANVSLFKGKSGVNIGVLDIFGFEVFQHNSFEQLCINYCNERLQTFFNEVIFEGEMKLYQAEGLPIDDITYQDNLGCVRLIDLRGAGLFAYLDEECSVPKGSDEKYVSKINMIFDETVSTKSLFFQRNHKSALNFTIRHFAGDVHYNAKDFLDKNRDALPEGLLNIVARSTILSNLSTTSDPNNNNNNNNTSSGKKGSGKLTLSAKFKSDLDALMTTLRVTQPHFIRCIKPNIEQVSTKFDAPLALNQLKYSGLFEAIRIRKAGYEVRIAHDQFIRRYKHITMTIPKEIRDNVQDRGQYAQALLNELMSLLDKSAELQKKRRLLEKAAAGNAMGRQKTAQKSAVPATNATRDVCVGKTRVFLRSQVLKVLFDDIREMSSGNLATPIQALIRGHLTRERLKEKFAAIRMSPEEKAKQRQREQQETRLMHQEDILAMSLEHIVRSDKGLQEKIQRARQQKYQEERNRVQRLRDTAATLIQSRFRGGTMRYRARVFLCEQLLERVISQRAKLHRSNAQNTLNNDQKKVHPSGGDVQSVYSGTTAVSGARHTRLRRQLTFEDFENYEKQLQRALQRPLEWRVSSKLIAFYSREVRKISLQVLEESHVEQSLRDATAVQSLPLLKQALSQAEKQHMQSYLPSYPLALQTCQHLLSQRTIVSLISEHLSQATSVSRLLTIHYDCLRWLVTRAVSLFQVHSDSVVREAVHRLKQTQSLFELRQSLRRAVEICAPQTMKRLMMQRKKHVKFFGEDFLQEEAVAVDNILHMLSYQQSLLSETQQEPTAVAIPQGKNSMRKMNMHEIYATMIRPISNNNDSVSSTNNIPTGNTNNRHTDSDGPMDLTEFESEEKDFLENNKHETAEFSSTANITAETEEAIYLPRFVREPLLRMKQAKNLQPPDHEMAQEAQAEFIALVPTEFSRRFYLRVFKWSVAFATWQSAWAKEEMLLEQRLAAVANNNINNSSNEGNLRNIEDMGSVYDAMNNHMNMNMTVLTGSPSKAPTNTHTLGRKTFATNNNTNNINNNRNYHAHTGPFAQRMTKSEVTAREVLKKGQQMTFRHLTHKTDTLISSTINEYGQTKKLVQKKSTF